jgi:two-component system CheB/CheR fusion protein
MGAKFVVAIGSSAGGLSPLTSYFDFTPHDQATYVILRHLPLDYKSQLQEILDRHSKLTICEATHGMPIKKDTIYMSPSDMYLTIKDDHLFLQSRTGTKLYPNWSIDIFLKSLAEAKGKFSIAVILSGAGTDGTIGAGLIKEAGGMVVAQNIASCQHSSMPRHAIESGDVDHELLPLEMPGVILQHINGILKNANLVQNMKDVGEI